jgi:hypothetical protein
LRITPLRKMPSLHRSISKAMNSICTIRCMKH